jgi:hypothetical protein
MRRILARAYDCLLNHAADILLPRLQDRLFHPHTLLLAEAQRQSADYIKSNMADALILMRREELIRTAFERAPVDGCIVEFGVGGGESIRLIAELAQAEESSRRVHGFDSFEGLPEDWPGRHEGKGHYGSGGRPPSVPANVDFHTGMFADTLPGFLGDYPEPCAFIHIDCDLYASTVTVLEALAPRIAPGTVILFDEYFNFHNWREHEFRAFAEFVERFDVAYRYICCGHQQAAVRIETIGG